MIAFLVGFALGAVAMFFVGRNNQTRLGAAYAKSLVAQADLQKQLDALKQKV